MGGAWGVMRGLRGAGGAMVAMRGDVGGMWGGLWGAVMVGYGGLWGAMGDVGQLGSVMGGGCGGGWEMWGS